MLMVIPLDTVAFLLLETAVLTSLSLRAIGLGVTRVEVPRGNIGLGHAGALVGESL